MPECYFKSVKNRILSPYHINRFKEQIMGRGDRRTRKGKIFKGSYGNSRPRKPFKTESTK